MFFFSFIHHQEVHIVIYSGYHSDAEAALQEQQLSEHLYRGIVIGDVLRLDRPLPQSDNLLHPLQLATRHYAPRQSNEFLSSVLR